MKKLLATVLSSVGEIAAWMESDPAVLSVMPKEMTSVKASSFPSLLYRDKFDGNKL